jgi:SagB-type dehydrogenase family enzyme
VRAFGDEPLALAEAAQLAWAAQGVTSADGLRNAPSAGALYPIELYLAARKVDGLAPGVYKYLPDVHRVRQWIEGDLGSELASGALNQDFVRRAAVMLVFTAVETRTTEKYRERGIRYVHIEIGHAAQNALLQAVAMGLSAVVVGAFDDLHVSKSLHLPETEQARYLMAVGNP